MKFSREIMWPRKRALSASWTSSTKAAERDRSMFNFNQHVTVSEVRDFRRCGNRVASRQVVQGVSASW